MKKFLRRSGVVYMIRTELIVVLYFIKYNILSAAELRTSFIMQVVGMMLNNFSLVLIWVMLFGTIGKINGWGSLEVIGLNGFVAVIYGFVMVFMGGLHQLTSVINTGTFDAVLLTPRFIYLRIMSLTTRTSAIGDMLYGIILLLVYLVYIQAGLLQIFMVPVLIVPGIMIFANVLLTASCLLFYIPDSESVSKNLFDMFLMPTLYPSGMFQGVMRFFFLFIIPSIAISGLPVETLLSFSLKNIAIIWGLAIAWTLIGLVVLRHGISRYESGNLTGARV